VHQNRWRWGFASDRTWGAYSAPQTYLDYEGRRREGREIEGMEEGREGRNVILVVPPLLKMERCNQ